MSEPHAIIKVQDGYLYFTENGGHSIDRVDPTSANPVPRRCDVDPGNPTSRARLGDLVATPTQGNGSFRVYFTDPGRDQLDRITVATGATFPQICATLKRQQLSA